MYRLLVDNQTDLVVKLDRDGHLQYVSPSYCDMFSRSEAELRNTVFHEHIHVYDLERVKSDWQKLFAKPWVTQFEHRAVTQTGNRWLGWALKAQRDDGGHVFEIVGVGRDVTARRIADEQARVSLNTLAHAGRMQSLGEMATTLAHELNQPLTAILSFSQASQRVIKKQDFDHDELVLALDRIAVNAKRAGDIIGNMRRFVRKEEPRTEVVGINKLINEAMDLVNSEVLYHEIDVELDLAELMPDVCVDPVQIQQVILNLVRNSMEAIESQAVDERCISIATRINRPGSIEVIVADSGPGLEPEIVEKLFDAFVTTKSEGMGVGLSICKSIVEAHGGGLANRQDPGYGAIFSFELPSISEVKDEH